MSISEDIQRIIDTQWSLRSGQKVPTTDDIVLAGGAVELEAVMLYADLANSSRMAKTFDRRVTAKILKSFLASTARIIQNCGGSIVSFDGDRILGVFLGELMNTNAAKAALQIKYAVHHIIRPKFETKYSTVKEADFRIDHGVGIDSGTVMVVRAGVRGASDLIWIGRAPNLAAKLSDLREPPYQSFITAAVYNRLNDSSKYGGEAKQAMWESRSWTYLGERISVYRSSWYWGV